MLSDRRRRVLNALIEEYISTAAPVSSKAIVGRHDLGVSSATVRNELYVLEEDGYVVSPHVSSGRIPTDTGYRTFVDELLENAGKRAAEGEGAVAFGVGVGAHGDAAHVDLIVANIDFVTRNVAFTCKRSGMVFAGRGVVGDDGVVF